MTAGSTSTTITAPTPPSAANHPSAAPTTSRVITAFGFHPLWQFSLVPLARLFTGDALIRAALILGLVCCLAAVLLVARLACRLCGPGPALFGGIVATQFALRSWVNGMEGPAVLLAVALLLTALTAAHRRGFRSCLLVGFASAVLVLARFDFALVVGIVPFAIWLRSRSWRAVASWCAGCALIAVPFGAWWLARWHHILTTSATVKNAWINSDIAHQFGGRLTLGYAHFLFDLSRDYLKAIEPWTYINRVTYGTQGVGAALALACAALGFICLAGLGAVVLTKRWRTSRVHGASPLGPEGWAITVGLALLAAKAVLDLLVAPLWATTWYSAPQRLATAFLFGSAAWIGVEWLWQHHKRIAYVAVATVILIALPVNAVAWAHVDTTPHAATDWQDQLDLAATWIAKHGPTGTYGVRDAGLLAHQLDGLRAVVNLDGLVNDYTFAKLVTSNASMRKRISAARVDYLVNRLSAEELRRLSCGNVIWTSPGNVPYSDPLSGTSNGHVYVIDVRACSTT